MSTNTAHTIQVRIMKPVICITNNKKKILTDCKEEEAEAKPFLHAILHEGTHFYLSLKFTNMKMSVNYIGWFFIGVKYILK